MKPLRPPKPAALTGPRSRRVLAIIGDTQVGLWAVRSLGRAGLKVLAVCESEDGLAAHSRYAAGAWVREHPADDPRFIDELEALAGQVGAGSIMPIAERFHQVLTRHRDRFEPRIHLFSPSAESFARATDKEYLHGLARRLGVPVARGGTLKDVIGSGDDHKLSFPLVLRTSRQNDPEAGGGCPWKAAYAADPGQLRDLHQQVRHFADNVLVQEYQPGVEDHVQILMHEGAAFMVGEYIGEHHMPLAGGVTVQRVTCRHENAIRDGVRLLQALQWEGVAGVQFHYDPQTDRYIFLEINPRFIGGLPTIIMAGFDVPYLLWQSHFEPDRMRRGRYRHGLRSRVVGGDANWLFGMLRGDPLPPGQTRPSKLDAIWDFLANFGPWTRDDVFSLTDLRPVWLDWRLMLNHLRRRSVGLIDREQIPEPAR